jgi:hypothetical protein
MKSNTILAALTSLTLAAPALAGTSASTGKACCVPPMPTADELLGFTLSAGWDSAYIFHGTDVGENLIWQKLEFTKQLTDKLSLNVGEWYGHLFDYTYNELDLYAGLRYNAGPVNLTAGFTYYDYIDGSSLSAQYEPSFSISTNNLPVDLYATYFYDFEVDGTYLEAGMSKTVKINDKISAVAGAAIGYNLGYNTQEDGWNHVGVKLALPISLTKTATLTPYVAGNFALDATEGAFAEDNLFFGGVSLDVKF